MIQTTNVYKQAIQDDRREWREKAIITLNDPSLSENDRVITLTNQNLWSGGFTVEDAVSADNVFQIGAAIVNKATLVINNIYGTYSDYDFTLADVQLFIGVAAECDIDTDILPPPPNTSSDPANGWSDGYIENNGTISAGVSEYKCKVSDFVPVDGGREYTVSYNFTQSPSANAETRISTYNRSKEFIATYTSETQSTGQVISFVQSLGLNVAYVRVSLRTFGMVVDDLLSSERFKLNETSVPVYYKKGKYVVNSATHNGSLISLELYDYMCKFDFPYTNSLTWPATPNYIVRNACNLCGVSYIGTSFPHQSAIQLAEPDGKALTFRDVISYVAQLCGCYARCNADGKLELKWYNQDALDTETPSGSGTNVWHIDSLYSKDISTIDIAPTVISITYETGNPEEPEYTSSVYIPNYSSTATYSIGDVVKQNGRIFKSLINNNTTAPTMSTTTQWRFIALTTNAYTLNVRTWSSSETYNKGEVVKRTNGNKIWKSLINGNTSIPNDANSDKWKYISENTLGYAIEIVNNPFITEDNVETILGWLGSSLLGHAFRKATVSHGSDPSIEAGDVAIAIMPDGTTYHRLLVSKTTFTTGSAQTTVSSAASPVKNESTKYSSETKNLVSLQRMIRKEISTRDAAYNDLVTALSSYGGLNLTTEPDEINGGTIFYLHDGQTVQTSSTVYKITAGGWGISTDGGQTWNAGITAYGVMVVNLLSATGISFDWAEGGTLTLGGSSNGNGILVVKDEDDEVVGRLDNTQFKIGNLSHDYGMYFDFNNSTLKVVPSGEVVVTDTYPEYHELDEYGLSLYMSFTESPQNYVYRLRLGYDGLFFERSTNSGSTYTKLGGIKIDQFEGTTTNELIPYGTFRVVRSISDSTNETSRTDLPVPSIGSKKFKASESPTGSAATFRYMCFGSNGQRTIIALSSGHKAWVCHYYNSEWTPWRAYNTGETITPSYYNIDPTIIISETGEFDPTTGDGWYNWSNMGNSWYYKNGCRVHLHIAASSLTANTNYKLGTMPTKWRPNKTIVTTGRGSNGGAFASAWINSSGLVTCYSTTTSCVFDLEYDAVQ